MTALVSIVMGSKSDLDIMSEAAKVLGEFGVPMTTSDLGGLDSLLSTVQMPGGIPVATTAIGKAGAQNAGLLAVSILALMEERLASQLETYRERMSRQVEQADADVQGMTDEA